MLKSQDSEKGRIVRLLYHNMPLSLRLTHESSLTIIWSRAF